jgi:hypothetical protein
MKIDKEILNEVNRFREIVGLQIILEHGISDPTKKLLKLFGSTSDETIDVLSRNVEFDNLIKASDQFTKLGITNVDSWKNYLTTKNLNIDDLTQDQVNKLISNVPELKSAIDEVLNKATKEVAEKLMKTQSLANIFPKELVDMVDKAKSISITQGTADSAYKFYQAFNVKLDNFISDLQKNRKQIPTELEDLRKLFKGKEDDALNYKKPSGASKSADNVSSTFDDFEDDMLGMFGDDPINAPILDDGQLNKLIEDSINNMNLPKSIDKSALINEVSGKLKQTKKTTDAAIAAFDSYTPTQRKEVIAKSLEYMNQVEKQMSSVVGAKESKWLNWFKKSNKILNETSTEVENIVWYKKLINFVWKNYRYVAIGCLIYKSYLKYLEIEGGGDLNAEGLEKNVIYCAVVGLAWPFELVRQAGLGIMDAANIGQYENTKKGFQQFLKKNQENGKYDGYSWDYDEDTKQFYITNSLQDVVTFTYDPDAETFIEEE